MTQICVGKQTIIHSDNGLALSRQCWSIIVCLFVLFVCFITKSLLTYWFFPPTPALSTISRPLSSSMCSITPETTNVCSSYNRMRGPGIGCWFSDRSNCSIINWTPNKQLHWKFNRKWNIFIQGNSLENIVWKMSAILSRSQCVKNILNLLLYCSGSGSGP